MKVQSIVILKDGSRLYLDYDLAFESWSAEWTDKDGREKWSAESYTRGRVTVRMYYATK